MAKKKYAPIVIGALGLVLCGVVYTSCSQPSRAEGAKRSPEEEAKPVAVEKVAKKDISKIETLMAEFRPLQEVDVHAKVAGYVQKILVDVGDHVSKGELLAVLEVPELKADLDRAASASRRAGGQVTQAEAELTHAEASHEVAHITYERMASLPKIKPSLIAQEEIDQAKARDAEAEAQVATAKAAIGVAKDRVAEAKADEERVRTLFSYTQITAPFTGIVTKRYADTGAMIPAGTNTSTQAMPLVRISEDDLLRLVLPVPEAIVPLVRLGAGVQVKVDALNRTFEGKVWRFTGKVDTSTRTMDTEVEVNNPGGVLKPGMYASATLTVDHALNAVVVPVQAVTVSGQTSTVLRVKSDNTLEECKITTGIQTPWDVQVDSGLDENDLVVVGNRTELKPGEKVLPKVVENPAAS